MIYTQKHFKYFEQNRRKSKTFQEFFPSSSPLPSKKNTPTIYMLRRTITTSLLKRIKRATQ